ncbi:hypothetical protein ACFV10_28540 [Streptomyces cyaneofuscatus]|uniref:hypothetical protein n=1 Tax=Streptomyces cyaneofuscatus TaxID=66883 RepID=UPI00367BD186
MSIIICQAPRFPIRRILRCATCKTRRRMLVVDNGWYGTSITCCHCGDTWQDGERALRSNKRGWRKEAAAKATTGWIEAGTYDPAAHQAWFEHQMGYET